jgi:HK97 family phage portal protein
MSLLDWIKGGEFRSSTLANPSGLLLEALGGSPSYSGERVTVEKALEVGAVRAAVEMISKSVGVLCPLKVYRIMDDDDRVEARTHRTWRMLHDMPNPVTTAASFWTAVAANILIWENAYIEKERDELGEVESLWLKDPTCMEVVWDGYNKSFVYTVDGKRRKYSTEEILHIPGFSTDGIYGSSRVTQAKQTLGTAIARAKFEGGFYKRGARNASVVEHPGRLGEKGIENLKRQLEVWHSGVDNMHKVPVLEEGATMKSIGQSLDDLQFSQMAQQTRTEIAVLFCIPPAYLGGTTGDSLTYATTESNQIQFAQMAVAPLTGLISGALSADPALLPWNVMYCEFVLEGLLRADMKTRAEYYSTMQPLLRLTPEYIAARENIPQDAIGPKPKPVPIAENGEAPLPPAMQEQAARVQALNS